MKLAPVRNTILGGIVFLVPTVVVIVIFGKAFSVMRAIAEPLGGMLPIASIAGLATLNILAIVALVLVCYLAGLVAISAIGRSIHRQMDDKLLALFPPYAFIKSMTEGVTPDDVQKTLLPVRIDFDDLSQIGFEVERSDQGLVTVYLPGAPDPWSGSVAYVEAERVAAIDASFTAVVSSLRKAGRGASQFLV